MKILIFLENYLELSTAVMNLLSLENDIKMAWFKHSKRFISTQMDYIQL